jgi:hypothetical protein
MKALINNWMDHILLFCAIKDTIVSWLETKQTTKKNTKGAKIILHGYHSLQIIQKQMTSKYTPNDVLNFTKPTNGK